MFHNRDSDECRVRYTKIIINAKVNQGRWSTEEVDQLLKYHRIFKNNWAKIAKLLKTRTANQIKDKIRELNKYKTKKGNIKLSSKSLPKEDSTNWTVQNENWYNNFTLKANEILSNHKSTLNLYLIILVEIDKTSEPHPKVIFKKENSYFDFSDINEIVEDWKLIEEEMDYENNSDHKGK